MMRFLTPESHRSVGGILHEMTTSQCITIICTYPRPPFLPDGGSLSSRRPATRAGDLEVIRIKRDQAKKLVDSALEKLDRALQEGHSDTLKAYLSAMGRFSRYSFGNILLIAMQRPRASRVAGFCTWRKLGRHVRRGEHGIAILAPVVYSAKALRSSKEASHIAHDSEPDASLLTEKVVGFRTTYVFDVSQTDGEPLPEFAKVTGDPREHASRLKGIIAERGIALEYAARLGGADGTSAVRETEAEAVAFVVCRAVGLDTNTAFSDYVQLYSGDKDTLAASLGRIQGVATTIIEALGLDGEVRQAA